jgi:hypothetical protein
MSRLETLTNEARDRFGVKAWAAAADYARKDRAAGRLQEALLWERVAAALVNR